ncbi:hypothetical protein [Rhizobium sp. ZPR3]|uniref:Uncharacterized protein n=2 Tax=unclassified Rhizobium TaxID=2613769 RepID=A0AAU7SMZ5_9HYPH
MAAIYSVDQPALTLCGWTAVAREPQNSAMECVVRHATGPKRQGQWSERPESDGAPTFASGSNNGDTQTSFAADPCFDGAVVSLGKDATCVGSRYNKPDLQIIGQDGYIQERIWPAQSPMVGGLRFSAPMHPGEFVCR